MRYASILDYDINNGEGVRVSLWTTGCPHACIGCHNEHMWDKTAGKKFTVYTLHWLLKLLEQGIPKDLSILGGEPLAPYNIEGVTAVCKAVKEVYPNKSIWLWTGYNYSDVQELEVMQYIDVLVDGRFEQELYSPDLEWRGSSNQRLHRLKDGKVTGIE